MGEEDPTSPYCWTLVVAGSVFGEQVTISLRRTFVSKRPSMPGVQHRGPGLVMAPALYVGPYLNVKLATPFVPSLNFTTSWRLVPAQFLLVFHT